MAAGLVCCPTYRRRYQSPWIALRQGLMCGSVTAKAHPHEPHLGSVSARLNWLRAGVLGANDGIVSTAGIVVGVAAATVARGPIMTAGIAGLAAGAVSMALGEYVSVSAQRDTEQALLHKESRELSEDPNAELDELAALLEAKGLSAATARTAAEELTDHDPMVAHAEVELGFDPAELTNPWQAALSSALSFGVGALLPLIAILVAPVALRIPITVATVLLALVITGAVSARLGGAPKHRAALRNFVGGGLALAITYLIGHLVCAAIRWPSALLYEPLDAVPYRAGARSGDGVQPGDRLGVQRDVARAEVLL